jgi:uncharacterized protein (TIGR03437 family)
MHPAHRTPSVDYRAFRIWDRTCGATPIYVSVLLMGLLAHPVLGQTGSLTLSSATTAAGGSASLSLTLSSLSGSQPAAIQWTLTYNAAAISSIAAAAGTSTTTAGDSPACVSAAGSYTCIISGLNSNTLQNGTVATINVTLAPTATGVIAVGLTNSLGASTSGTAIALTGSGGSITVSPAAPVISSATSATGTVGMALYYQITATNSPTSYGATGLPSGLSANPATGLISGTPTASGTSSATLSATNSGGTGTATLTLTIAAPATGSTPPASGTVVAPVISSAMSASGAVGAAFSYQITASNSPTSYGAAGLPAGLSVNPGTGQISGTPTASGTSNLTLSATNSGGTGHATLTLIIAAAAPATGSTPPASGTVVAPVISSSTSASGTVGTAFSYQITATNSPTSYGAAGLPAGLSVSPSTGLISGTPTASGTSSVTLTVTNTGGTGTTTLTLTIAAASVAVGAPVITSATSTSGTVGTAFSYQITATNSPTSYGATGLPAGLSVNSSTGLISGVPTASGTSNVTLTATNSGGTGQATLRLTLAPASPLLTSLSCTPIDLAPNANSTCTVTLNQGAPVGGSTITLSSDNPTLTMPSSVLVPASSGNVSFTATTGSFRNRQTAAVRATLNSSSQTASLSLAPVARQVTLHQFSCSPRTLSPGSRATCSIALDPTAPAASSEIRLSSSSGALHLPDTLVTRPQQRQVEFQVEVVGAEKSIVVTAHLGEDSVQETLAINTDSAAVLEVPGRQFVRYGTEIRFRVSTADPAATVSTGALPAGAGFDSEAGEFRWTPDSTQLGPHVIDFNAVDSSGRKGVAAVTVEVETGEPRVTAIVNAASRSRDAACSPGARAVLEGRWLISGTEAVRGTGNSLELAGTRVWANGMLIPILTASPVELQILCPDAVSGSEIQFVVQTDHGFAAPMRASTRSSAPGIFSVDGSGAGQGWIVLASANRLAMVRNSRLPSQPAVAGDRVVLFATGIDGLTNLTVQIGGYAVTPAVISPVAGQPGLFQIAATVPEALAQTGDLPVWLSADTPEGIRIRTNAVTIAIESNLL